MTSSSSDKICSLAEACTQVAQWQTQGDKVVFTNGCFDILHLGHIDYLEKARAKGQKLVVGLNTDASVKILKGEKRPINNEYSRARMLAALWFVDLVVYFEEQTPLTLIQTLKPNVLVKGSDYLAENIVGADFVLQQGGSVETITLVDGYSTTHLIDKIKNT